ncbi:break repair meiotic recombinase recruitment factor 1 isoform X1 [Castor canadensis]|uniref:Break repair meiotic recombinase recruitment factor 1 isoform X1 n=1 Tax=Castor canadensis TaxID=51338 RepID=A0AC58KYU8_CASCN
MSKRKKLRTSGEGGHPPRPPKNPRLQDSDRGCPSSEFAQMHRPEKSEDNPGLSAPAEQSREEAGQAVPSSCPDAETGAACRLMGQTGEELVALPSQSSVGRFVPQFVKPRKAVTRNAEVKEEDPEIPATSLGTPPQPAGSQPREELLGLARAESRGPGHQMQADGACSQHSNQHSVTPVPGSGDSQPEVSPQGGTGLSDSERASQDSVWEQETNPSGNNRPETHSAQVPGDGGQKRHPPSSAVEGKEVNGRLAQGGAGTNLPGGDQEEGGDIPGSPASGSAQELSPAAPCLKAPSVTQGPPIPMQMHSGTGGRAEQSCSPAGASLVALVIVDVSTDPSEPKQRAPEVAEPDGQAEAGPPVSPRRQAPGRDSSRTLWRDIPPARKTGGGRGEAGLEKSSDDTLLSPAAFLAVGSPGLRVDTGDLGHPAPEVGLGISQTQVPSPDSEWPGGMCALPLLVQPADGEESEMLSQSHKQDPRGLALSLPASSLLEHREAADGPPQDTRTLQSGPDPLMGPKGQLRLPLDSADQAAWPESSAVELDFLPDSQIQNALDVPDLETPLEQAPQGSRGPRGLADGGCYRHSARPHCGNLQPQPSDHEHPP